MQYKFYLQKANAAEQPVGEPLSLEDAFPGVHYMKMEGLESQGSIKNIYSETFPDKTGDLIYHPSDNGKEPAFASTKLTLTVLAEGQTHREQLRALRELLTSGRLFWWDTARHLKAYMVMKDEQTISIDRIKGLQYIQAAFTFSNLWGRGVPCTDDGSLIAEP